MYNKNKRNQAFTENDINAVWNKGKIIPGYDPNIWRRDACNVSIKRSEYGNTNSANGWEIDHIKPKSLGGGDELSNLQPLQWENNRHKGDNWPNWSCKIGSKL